MCPCSLSKINRYLKNVLDNFSVNSTVGDAACNVLDSVVCY